MTLAVLWASACCLAQAGAPANLVVTVPVVNMYSAASEDTDVVSQAIYGSNVVRMEEKSGWAKVRTPDQYSGWVRLAELRPQDHLYAASGEIIQVNSLTANLYREADVTAHRPLLTVPFERGWR